MNKSTKLNQHPIIAPVSYANMLFAAETASMIYARQLSNIAIKRGVGVHIEDMGVSLKLTDDPLNHIGLTLAEHFKKDRQTFLNVMMRFFALQTVFSDERLQENFIKEVDESPDHKVVHPGVFFVASCLPLNKDLLFEPDQFVKAAWYMDECGFLEEGELALPEEQLVKEIIALTKKRE